MTSIIENEVKKERVVDVVVAPKAINEQPGGLRSETRMTIQTRQAQRVVVGRKRAKGVQSIIGLLDFGRRMKLLWLSAQADDPYADWYLLKVEESINESKLVIKEKKEWLNEILHSMNGFDIDIAKSMQPIQVPIVFQNPYGYMGAYLVSEFDELCCSIFTASHIGLIDRKTASDMMNAAGRSIRRTFELSAKWKFTGVTRQDVLDKTANNSRAIELYGECPEPIVNKDKRAAISPEIRVKTKQVKVMIKKSSETNKEGENKKDTTLVLSTQPKDKDKDDYRETVSKSLFSLA